MTAGTAGGQTLPAGHKAASACCSPLRPCHDIPWQAMCTCVTTPASTACSFTGVHDKFDSKSLIQFVLATSDHFTCQPSS